MDKKNNNMIYYENGTWNFYDRELIKEEPLLIHIEDSPYSVVMRTPGDEIFHGAGFCLAEGIVDNPDDFANIGFCADMDSNVISIKLLPKRRDKVADLLKRRGFISQTSCGICGKELIKDLHQILHPVFDKYEITIEQVQKCLKQINENQHLHKKTGAAHGCMIFDSKLNPLASAEDVGRHNALDKAVGKVFMDRKLDKAYMAFMSSRISYELVQKAARAKISILIGMSRPTSLAVELGKALNMTIACAGKKKGIFVFCGNQRFKQT